MRSDNGFDDVFSVQAVLHAQNDGVVAKPRREVHRRRTVVGHLRREQHERARLERRHRRDGAHAAGERLAADDAQPVALDRLGVRLPRDDGHVVTPGELRGIQAADRSRPHHNDVLEHFRFQILRWRKNSWLPVAPVIAAGTILARVKPAASALAVTAASTDSWTAGSVTRPPLPT